MRKKVDMNCVGKPMTLKTSEFIKNAKILIESDYEGKANTDEITLEEYTEGEDELEITFSEYNKNIKFDEMFNLDTWGFECPNVNEEHDIHKVVDKLNTFLSTKKMLDRTWEFRTDQDQISIIGTKIE